MSTDSDTSSEDMFCQYDAVDALRHKPAPELFLEEIILKNTYTYDDEPIKEYREISDYLVLKECNDVIWGKISKLLGDVHGFHNNLCIYREKDIHILISKIICKNNCYYLPKNCFLDHEKVDLKSFFNRKLHEQFNPGFASLFEKKTNKVVKLQRAESGMPIMWKLAEDIGINTIIEYDDSGHMKVNFDVLNHSFWDEERPIFFMEEKKILDVIYALLTLSLLSSEDVISEASLVYMQKASKLNDPVLKVMCHGPDFDKYVEVREVNKNRCDLSKDEAKVKHSFVPSIKHNLCQSFKSSDHWTFVHGEDDYCEDIDEKFILTGPVAMKDSFAVIYPCNLNHCWVICKCRFCDNMKTTKCVDHMNHIKFNVKECIIQKRSQCQDHLIDHPDNFDEKDDIQIEKKLLFHNGKILKHGQNYFIKCIKYAGLKKHCKRCKEDTKEHYTNHCTPHLQCKHCLHELKSMEDVPFWEKVCSLCGKEFKSFQAMKEHVARHAIPNYVCSLCEIAFSSKFTLERHINEQHNSQQRGSSQDEEIADLPFVCDICGKTFVNLRNMDSHCNSFHTNQDPIKCKVCGQEFRKAYNLKVHLKNQHNVIETPVQSAELRRRRYSKISMRGEIRPKISNFR